MVRNFESLLNIGKCVLLYGMTPPKASNTLDKLLSITKTRKQRLAKVKIDGLVIYDIQPEPSRSGENRPFPFLETVDPVEYRERFLAEVELPTVIYQCVGKYTTQTLKTNASKFEKDSMVFVGAATREQKVLTTMKEAYQLAQGNHWPYLGGIVIPERHLVNEDEHLRMLKKQSSGVKYFISQFVFDIDNLKNLLSDYYYACVDGGLPMVPIIFTLTPCGSGRTIELLKFLGVHFPHWVENDLVHSKDPIKTSLDMAMASIKTITEFCLLKGIPFGFNVESVSIKRDEVLASFDLVTQIHNFLLENNLRC